MGLAWPAGVLAINQVFSKFSTESAGQLFKVRFPEPALFN